MKMLTLMLLTFLLSIMPALPQGRGQQPPCDPAASEYICGQNAPEDLVIVPGGAWVVATSFATPGPIRIINTADRTTTVAYPGGASRERFDSRTYGMCPGAPDEKQKASFQTHGVAIREGANSIHTLYVVHHGTRESIEVFELDSRQKPPVLTWIGCAVAPDPIGLNEVVPIPGGGFIATDFLARNIDAGQRGRVMAGEKAGGLWEWQSATGWKLIPGSEASAANGLEISKDGKTLYVAAWGSQSFFRMSYGQIPAKRDDIPLGFRADNVRWAPDGTLFVVGQGGTGQTQTTNVVKIHPETLQVTELVRRPNTPEFGAGTVAVQLGRELWIGSYRGNRILRVPAP
jgi:hypothetical protein